jgi:hypothetical protein
LHIAAGAYCWPEGLRDFHTCHGQSVNSHILPISFSALGALTDKSYRVPPLFEPLITNGMVKQDAHEIAYFRFGGVREAVFVSPLTRRVTVRSRYRLTSRRTHCWLETRRRSWRRRATEGSNCPCRESARGHHPGGNAHAFAPTQDR